MVIVLAGMSLVVAFAALWLASDARKRTDAISHDFINTYIKAVRNKIADSERKVDELAAEISKLSTGLRTGETAHASSEQKIASLTAEIHKLNSELNELDQSIPSRYRVRTHAA